MQKQEALTHENTVDDQYDIAGVFRFERSVARVLQHHFGEVHTAMSLNTERRKQFLTN